MPRQTSDSLDTRSKITGRAASLVPTGHHMEWGAVATPALPHALPPKVSLNLAYACIEALGNAIVYLNRSQHVIYANSASHALFGEAFEEVLGLHITEILPRLETARWQAITAQCRATGSHTLHTALPPGAAQSSADVVVLEQDCKGEPFTILVFKPARSTARRPQAPKGEAPKETTSLGANRTKSAFLAHMSHELRTPLNGILGYAQILSQSTLTHVQRRGVQTIRSSGEHLLALINDLLDLSRIEVGRMALDKTHFDLHELLDSVVAIHRPKAHHKGLQLFASLSPRLPQVVEGDSRRLRQVLLNLLGNAVKFTQEGEIRLHASINPSVPGVLRFEVKDTGIGIAQSHQEEIFKPFRQAHGLSEALSDQGAGLGLAISNRLVQMMGGRLEVDSLPGQGATFTFEILLPTSQEQARPLVARQHRIGYSGSPKRLLVVDDRKENRSILINMLEPLGFEVQEAHNGLQALKLADEFQPDAILMDLVMPELDGFETTRRLRSLPALAKIKIIALSASVFDEDRTSSMIAGCDAFLPKPVCLEELLDTLGQVLDLGWIHTQPKRLPTQTSSRTLSPIPEDVLQGLSGLREFARQGLIIAVRRESAHLKEQHKAKHGPLEDLWTHIDQMIEGFEMEALRDFIDSLCQGHHDARKRHHPPR